MGTDRRRILILIKGLGIGGAERLISEGSQFWDDDRFDYSVAYALPWKDQLVGDLLARDVPTHMIGSPRGVTPSFPIRLRRHLASIKPDLVHAHLPSMGIAARLLANCPVVYTEHNLVGSYRPVTRIASRATYRRNAAVIAVSDAVAESVATWGAPDLRVIPNGVVAMAHPDKVNEARSELGLENGAPLAVHVGNIRPGKGHDMLVDAAAILIEKHPDLTIVSIGVEKYPGDLARLEEKARALHIDHRLRFLGRRADALNFVAAADLFINPSTVEGLPLAVMEAMLLGVPVVATSAGGVPTLVHDGSTGLLVEPGDTEALASAASRVLSEPHSAKERSEEAKALIVAKHGLEAMVHATEDVYREVLGD